MKDVLTWGLRLARAQTLSLVADVSTEEAYSRAVPGEHHPPWILGHLLLADSYLLTLLGAAELPGDFRQLLHRYGPEAPPIPSPERYDDLPALVRRLTDTGVQRLVALEGMPTADLVRPTPDPVLARAQPTIGHHLQALVCHEGYHAGQLAAWRRARGLPPGRWAFAPPVEPTPDLKTPYPTP